MHADPHVGQRKLSKYPAFDGLRALAALLVIAYHVTLAGGWTRTGGLAPLASELKGGVTVFFVISGFLLYLPYARAIRDRRDLPDWHAYARRRALRILPAYWVALTVLAIVGLATSVFSWNWWLYYGLAQIYHRETTLGGLSVAWTLCVEVTFYLCLPLMARGMAALVSSRPVGDRFRWQLAVVAAVGLGSLTLRVLASHSLVGPVSSGHSVLETALPGTLDWFALGIGLAVIASAWEAQVRIAPLLSRLAQRGYLCWLLAAGCYLAGAWTQHGDEFLPLYGVVTHVTLGLASALLVLPAAVPSSGTGTVPILTRPILIWLGTISYGMYLWHSALITGIQRITGLAASHPAGPLPVLALAVAGLAAAVALGAASWYVVERPAQRLGSRSAVAAWASGRRSTWPGAKQRTSAPPAHQGSGMSVAPP